MEWFKSGISRLASKRSQSTVGYIVTYGLALLLLAVIMALLYLFVIGPKSVVPFNCSFTKGAYCNDIIIGTNATTHQTKLAVLLTNTQPYPIANPALFAQLNRANTSTYKCSPNFVPPGGSIVCSINLPVNTSLGTFLSGNLYLNATACTNSSTAVSQTCTGAPKVTYTGSFNTNAQPLIQSTSSATVTLVARNLTQAANGGKDPLYATVKLLGYPLKSATVQFTYKVLTTTTVPTTTTVARNCTGPLCIHIQVPPSGSFVSSQIANTSSPLVTRLSGQLSENVVVNYPPGYGGSYINNTYPLIVMVTGWASLQIFTNTSTTSTTTIPIPPQNVTVKLLSTSDIYPRFLGIAINKQLGNGWWTNSNLYTCNFTISSSNVTTGTIFRCNVPTGQSFSYASTSVSSSSPYLWTINVIYPTGVSLSCVVNATTRCPSITTTTTTTSITSTSTTSTSTGTSTIPGYYTCNICYVTCAHGGPCNLQCPANCLNKQQGGAFCSGDSQFVACLSSSTGNQSNPIPTTTIPQTSGPYTLQPPFNTTNAAGVATSFISGTTPGNVIVTANYSGIYANATINFVPPATLSFVLSGFPSCSTSGTTIATVDGVPYTCQQLSTKNLSFASGTQHTLSFTPAIQVSTSSREVFKSFVVNSAPYTQSQATITVSGSTVVYAYYYPQYYFAESANPTNGGSVAPGSSWYNSSAQITLNAVPSPQYYFTGWTCTGNGCYSGASNPQAITITGPISETAIFGTQGGTITTTASTTSTTSTIPPGVNQYTLTTGPSGCVTPVTANYVAGLSVTINANLTCQNGLHFGSWVGTGSGNYTGPSQTGTVVMNGNIQETAIYTGTTTTTTTSTTTSAPPSQSVGVKLVSTNDIYPRYLGIAINEQLGSNWYNTGSYTCQYTVSSGNIGQTLACAVPSGNTFSYTQVAISSFSGYIWNIQLTYPNGTSTSCTVSNYVQCPTTTTTSTSTAPTTSISGGGGGGASFVSGTRVLMSDGAYKQIQSIQPGDIIISYDTNTQRLYPNVVQKVISYTANGEYLINGVVGTDRLELFYTQRGWMSASDLVAGDSIFNPPANTWIPVQSVQYISTNITVYDIIGTSSNNFLVGDGYLADLITQ